MMKTFRFSASNENYLVLTKQKSNMNEKVNEQNGKQQVVKRLSNTLKNNQDSRQRINDRGEEQTKNKDNLYYHNGIIWN